MTRECGSCTMCCTLLRIDHPDLQKERYVPCGKLCSSGCSIYSDPNKPSICSTFQCLWLNGTGTGELLRDEDRPDTCGVMFTLGKNSPRAGREARQLFGCSVISAHESYRGAADTYRARKIIDRLARRVLVVVVWENERRIAGGPGDSVARATRLIHQFRAGGDSPFE